MQLLLVLTGALGGGVGQSPSGAHPEPAGWPGSVPAGRRALGRWAGGWKWEEGASCLR